MQRNFYEFTIAVSEHDRSWKSCQNISHKKIFNYSTISDFMYPFLCMFIEKSHVLNTVLIFYSWNLIYVKFIFLKCGECAGDSKQHHYILISIKECEIHIEVEEIFFFKRVVLWKVYGVMILLQNHKWESFLHYH